LKSKSEFVSFFFQLQDREAEARLLARTGIQCPLDPEAFVIQPETKTKSKILPSFDDDERKGDRTPAYTETVGEKDIERRPTLGINVHHS
jgi:hypothetical protein